jgi:hypothetical protein
MDEESGGGGVEFGTGRECCASDLQTIAENGAAAEPGYVAMTICHNLSVFWRSGGPVREVGRE